MKFESFGGFASHLESRRKKFQSFVVDIDLLILFQLPSISFTEKSRGSLLSLDSKSRSLSVKKRSTICMSLQQASRSKVSVTPLELEDPKETPLNLYRPKEPYTATIVSVERIVGPQAPGETCHIVIDHDGNVPYWEGQSYGVIPPVSGSLTKVFSFF